MGITFADFMMHVRRTKKKVNSIESLRKMWGSENLDHQMRKCVRILSYDFMRKHCLRYIFHSKVRNFGTHIKYRKKLIEGISDPRNFTHIKDYWSSIYSYPLHFYYLHDWKTERRALENHDVDHKTLIKAFIAARKDEPDVKSSIRSIYYKNNLIKSYPIYMAIK